MAKVIKDPVLGEIVLEEGDQWVTELINTVEFQRLRHISQLGLTQYVFPGAVNTRFMHSLGAYEIARRFIDALMKKNAKITANQRKIVLASALLHDVGHGPFSHAFETFTKSSHEAFSTLIIISSTTEINGVLLKNRISPEEICQVIDHSHPDKWMCQLISSHLDVDRLDYLMRDSYFTGTIYGVTDVKFLIQNANLVDGSIVFSEKTIPTIENYLLGRYHMFIQTYENRSSFAFEIICRLIFLRVQEIYKSGYNFSDENSMMKFFVPIFAEKKYKLEDYLKLDDHVMHLFLKGMEFETDEILRDLGRMFNRRHGFKVVKYDRTLEQTLLEKAKIMNIPKKYSVISTDVLERWIYKSRGKNGIFIQTTSGEIKEISKVSLFLKDGDELVKEKRYLVYNKKLVKPD